MWGMSLSSTSRASPTRATSTFTFLLISARSISMRSEEHTSELQSHLNLVCRLLLEKKKQPLRAISDVDLPPHIERERVALFFPFDRVTGGSYNLPTIAPYSLPLHTPRALHPVPFHT